MSRVEETKIVRLSPIKKVKVITIKEGGQTVSSHIVQKWSKKYPKG